MTEKTTVYFENPTMGQDKEITDVQHLVADSIPSDMVNDYMSEKYEEVKGGMIVYRFEHPETGETVFAFRHIVTGEWIY